jgi:hypothetical protein
MTKASPHRIFRITARKMFTHPNTRNLCKGLDYRKARYLAFREPPGGGPLPNITSRSAETRRIRSMAALSLSGEVRG